MHPEKITVAYLRVSTQAQSTEGEGLEIQKNKILDYCKEKGFKLEKTYEDAGISGTIKERPGLLELLKDCEAGTIKRAIVYKMDRLARELTVSLWLEKEFKKFNVELNAVEDPPYDLEDPLQKAFKHIADIFAELEKDVIMMRMREGRINKAKNGERACGPLAFGFRKTDNGMEIDPAESSWVQKIFQWKIKGLSYTEIIRKLSRAGVVSKRQKPFSIEGLKYVLRNEIYYGQIIFGDITQRGTHEPIVGKRTFLKAQRILDEKRP
ncbi:MAG: recombinase family protein [Candidatus Omnitrophota bacterium]